MHHDIPDGTEHPHGTHDNPNRTQDISHIYHDIPHGTEHLHCTQDIPTVLMISPTVLNTPTVLHTHYTGWYLN